MSPNTSKRFENLVKTSKQHGKTSKNIATIFAKNFVQSAVKGPAQLARLVIACLTVLGSASLAVTFVLVN